MIYSIDFSDDIWVSYWKISSTKSIEICYGKCSSTKSTLQEKLPPTAVVNNTKTECSGKSRGIRLSATAGKSGRTAALRWRTPVAISRHSETIGCAWRHHPRSPMGNRPWIPPFWSECSTEWHIVFGKFFRRHFRRLRSACRICGENPHIWTAC